MTWILDNLDLILSLTIEHLRQSGIAIVLSFVLAIPLGALAWRFRLVRGGIITLTSLLYTIPSIALLVLVPTALGISLLSEFNLILALTLYGIALMVRSVAEGLDSVDDDVRLAAVAMGYGPLRRFATVDLPLAGPVILAGLRVTSVSTIALATVGALIGTSNLGYLFTNGYQRRITEEILSGIVAVVIVALVIDLLLVLAGRFVLPWARAATTAGTRIAVTTGAAA
ncbi:MULTISPECIES: ABC transporter permease [unclassified Microbacterium]|uniref:ABC transporter permease n=1 Tax=unclassified Microbacterium TaxID=2609290 RepID=UPI0038703910